MHWLNYDSLNEVKRHVLYEANGSTTAIAQLVLLGGMSFWNSRILHELKDEMFGRLFRVIYGGLMSDLKKTSLHVAASTRALCGPHLCLCFCFPWHCMLWVQISSLLWLLMLFLSSFQLSYWLLMISQRQSACKLQDRLYASCLCYFGKSNRFLLVDVAHVVFDRFRFFVADLFWLRFRTFFTGVHSMGSFWLIFGE